MGGDYQNQLETLRLAIIVLAALRALCRWAKIRAPLGNPAVRPEFDHRIRGLAGPRGRCSTPAARPCLAPLNAWSSAAGGRDRTATRGWPSASFGTYAQCLQRRNPASSFGPSGRAWAWPSGQMPTPSGRTCASWDGSASARIQPDGSPSPLTGRQPCGHSLMTSRFPVLVTLADWPPICRSYASA